jgi:hypothetical protein
MGRSAWIISDEMSINGITRLTQPEAALSVAALLWARRNVKPQAA